MSKEDTDAAASAANSDEDSLFANSDDENTKKEETAAFKSPTRVTRSIVAAMTPDATPPVAAKTEPAPMTAVKQEGENDAPAKALTVKSEYEVSIPRKNASPSSPKTSPTSSSTPSKLSSPKSSPIPKKKVVKSPVGSSSEDRAKKFGLPKGVRIPSSIRDDLMRQSSGKMLDTLRSLRSVSLINDALQEYDEAVQIKGESIRNHGAYLYGVIKRYVNVQERASKAGANSASLPMGHELTPPVHQRLQKLVQDGVCKPEELPRNEKILAKLRMLSEKDALSALEEIVSVERSSIRNFGSYLMGILNRYMRGDTQKLNENNSRNKGGGKGNRGRSSSKQDHHDHYRRERSRDRDRKDSGDYGHYGPRAPVGNNNSHLPNYDNRRNSGPSPYGPSSQNPYPPDSRHNMGRNPPGPPSSRGPPPPPPPPPRQSAPSHYQAPQQQPQPSSHYGPPQQQQPNNAYGQQQPRQQQQQPNYSYGQQQQQPHNTYGQQQPPVVPQQQQQPPSYGVQQPPQSTSTYYGTQNQQQQQPQQQRQQQQYGSNPPSSAYGGQAPAQQQQQYMQQQQPPQQQQVGTAWQQPGVSVQTQSQGGAALPAGIVDILGIADKAASALSSMQNPASRQPQQQQPNYSYGQQQQQQPSNTYGQQQPPAVPQQQQPPSYGVQQAPQSVPAYYGSQNQQQQPPQQIQQPSPQQQTGSNQYGGYGAPPPASTPYTPQPQTMGQPQQQQYGGYNAPPQGYQQQNQPPPNQPPPQNNRGGRKVRRTTAQMFELPPSVQNMIHNIQNTRQVDGPLDDGILGMVKDLPEDMALQSLQKFIAIDKNSMRNKTAYLAGVLRRELERIHRR